MQKKGTCKYRFLFSDLFEIADQAIILHIFRGMDPSERIPDTAMFLTYTSSRSTVIAPSPCLWPILMIRV